MFSTFFIKIYFLFLFLFIFIFAFRSYGKIDSFQILITLYGISLIPLKILFTNHFERLIGDFKYKNILYFLKICLSAIFVAIGYIFVGNDVELLFIISYVFLLFYSVQSYHLFTLALVYFGGFFLNYFLGNDALIYSNYLIFGLYSLLFGILSISLEKYVIYKNIFGNSVLFLCGIYFFFSFYIPNLVNYIPIIGMIVLFIFNISKENFHYVSNKNFDIIIICLAIILFIPFINDFLNFEEQNILLLSSILGFIFSYIGYNLILKKALS